MFGLDKDNDNEIDFSSLPTPEEVYRERYRSTGIESSSSNPVRRLVADPLVGLAKGAAVGIPETVVGLLDIPTMGYAGKVAETVSRGLGLGDFKSANEMFDNLLTPETREAQQKVAEAKGFLPTIATAIQNPSSIVQTVAESIPSMVGGMRVAGGIAKLVGKPLVEAGIANLPRIAKVGGIAEGVITAGQNVEQTRQQTEEGTLTPFQVGINTVSGILTGMIGVTGGRLAQRFGLEDIDTLLTNGWSGIVGDEEKEIFKKVLMGAFQEGVLEELPQSMQEQIAQNLALNKPIDDGVFEAGAMGMLAGFAQSTGANIAGSTMQKMKNELDPINRTIKKIADETLPGELNAIGGWDNGKLVENLTPTAVSETPSRLHPSEIDYGEEISTPLPTPPEPSPESFSTGLQGIARELNVGQFAPLTAEETGVESVKKLAHDWDMANRTHRSDSWFEGAKANEESRNGFNEALSEGGDQLQAHGMAKESTLSGAIDNLTNILMNGLDQTRRGGILDTAPLANRPGEGLVGATATGSAYSEGPFQLVAKKGAMGIRNQNDIAAILVNQEHANMVPALRQHFQSIIPNIIVDSYSNAGKVTKQIVTDTRTEQKNALPAPEQKVGMPTPVKNIVPTPELEKQVVSAPEVSRGGEQKADKVHRPVKPENGSSLDDLTNSFSEDIYSKNALEYFGEGNSYDKQSINLIKSLKNKPDADVKIYRTVDKGVKDFNSGDWVTINKNYAVEHGEGIMGGKYDIIEKTVKAKNLISSGDSLHEFGYYPETTRKSEGKTGKTEDSEKVKKAIKSQLVEYKAELINRLASLTKEKAAAKSTRETDRLERLISTTETELDRYLREKTLPQDRIDSIRLAQTEIAKAGGKIPKTSEEAQIAIDNYETELIKKYGKKAVIEAPIGKFESGDFPYGKSPLSEPDLAKLNKLYENRDNIDKVELDKWHKYIYEKSGLSKQEVDGALKSLNMPVGSDLSIPFTAEGLRKFGEGERDTDNLKNLYNNFSKETYADFKFSDNPDNPVIQGVVYNKDGRPGKWDKEALKKTEKLFNTIGETQGREPLNLLVDIANKEITKPPITNQEQLKQRLAEGKRLTAEKRAEAAGKPIAKSVEAVSTKEPWQTSDLAVKPNIKIESIHALKQSDGKFKLFYRGTRNEVFPGNTFNSATDARNFFTEQKNKALESNQQKTYVSNTKKVSTETKPAVNAQKKITETDPETLNLVLHEMRSELETGTPGGFQGHDENGNPIYAKSGYQGWFSDLVKKYGNKKTSPTGEKESINAKYLVNIINKGLKNDKLTSTQSIIWEDVNKIADHESGKTYAGLVNQFEKIRELQNETRKQLAEEEINAGEIAESKDDLISGASEILESEGYSPEQLESNAAEITSFFDEMSKEPSATKQSWEQTREEFVGEATGDERAIRLAAHAQHVKQAIADGERVPLEVLNNYKNNGWAQIAIDKIKSKGDVQTELAGTDSFNLANPETEISKKLPEQSTPKNEDMFNKYSVKEIKENKNLAIVHNLTINNLRHAIKQGGLAVPSMAVIDVSKSRFDSFGDITLIASKDRLGPEASRTNKYFNADVYSPRYPKVTYFLTEKSKKSLENWLEPLWNEIPKAKNEQGGMTSHYTLFSDIEQNGIDTAFEHGDALLHYSFLKDIGKLPENIDTSWESKNKLRDTVNKIGKDKYEEWATAKVKKLGLKADEKIFNGFTGQGNRKYLKHDLDTVVRLLKKELKDGEGFNYGAPSIRATNAMQFKTVKQMQANRDKIISSSDMEKLKEETNDELVKLANQAAPHLKYGKNEFGVLDRFTEHIKEAIETKNFNKVFGEGSEYYEPGVEIRPIIDYVNKLRNMPTEYFEGKIQRAVGLTEFSAAVVPEETPKDITDWLSSHGIKVETYKKGERAKAVKKAARESNVLFTRGDSAAGLQQSQVQSVIDQALKSISNPPKVNIIQSNQDCPESVQKIMEEYEIDDAMGFTHNGEVYLVANNIRNEEEIFRTLAHELTHSGLGKFFQRQTQGKIMPVRAEYEVLMDAIYRAHTEEVEQLSKTTHTHLNTRTVQGRRQACEEWLCNQSYESQPKWYDKLVAIFNDLLRAVGLNVKLSDAEVRVVLQDAFKEFGDRQIGVRRSQPMFSRSDNPDYKWWEGMDIRKQLESLQFKFWQKPRDFIADGYVPITRAEADKFYYDGMDIFVARVDLKGAETTGNEGWFMRPRSSFYGYQGYNYDETYYQNKKAKELYQKYSERYSLSERERKDTVQEGMRADTGIQDGLQEVAFSRRMFGDLKPLDYISSYIPDSLSSWFKQTSSNSIPPTDISQTNGTWEIPASSTMNTLNYILADRNIDLRDTVKSIEKTHGILEDQKNTSLKETLFSGRLSSRLDDFVNNELHSVISAMAKNGISIAQIEEYLHARHAEEANDYLDSLPEDKRKGNAGISTEDANDYLDSLDPALKEKYEKIALMLDKITHENAQLLVNYGLESQETIDKWFNKYKHYVPLFREDIEERPGTGQGFTVAGSASKGRTGSERKVVHILSNIAMQRERTLTRGEKNRVSQSLVSLAENFPNEDFWKIIKISRLSAFIAPGIEAKIKPNVVVARIKDEETGEIKHIGVQFNENNKRAMRMAAALKNMDMDNIGEILGTLGKITRYVSAINTQYNPVFGVTNFFRDMGTAAFNLSTTTIAGKQKKVLSNVLPAMKGIWQATRGDELSEMAKLFKDFQLHGGQTGYRNLFVVSQDRAKAIEKELKSLQAGKPRRYLSAFAKILSDYNTMSENSIRLSAYKVGIESGMTKDKAAAMAKNLTVNFNKKGQIAGQAGALYAFFNASVQGAVRMYETLKGPMGYKIIAGGIILGAAQAMMLAAAGFKDEEPPEFVKERNVIIPIGDKKYITFPMPLGFNVIPNVGRILAEITLGGGKNAGVKMSGLIGIIMETFNPLGSSGLSMQTVAPTFLDPFAALAENKNWTGRPIYKEDFNSLNPTPGTSRVKDSATALGRGLAWAFNILTGGNKYTPGLFSPTPDQIDYLSGQITGGLGREIGKTSMMFESLYTGEELPAYKLPLTGRFYGTAEGRANESNKYYSNLKKLNVHEANIKGRIKDREPVSQYIKDNPEAKLWRMANTVENTISRIKKRRESARTPEAKKIYDKLITLQMKRLNDRMEKAGD